MKLQAILLEQRRQLNENRKMMVESSAEFWSELIRIQHLPLSESARGDEMDRLTGMLVQTAFKLPQNQIDEFQRIFEMGIDKSALEILNESDEQLFEVFDSVKNIWSKFKGLIKKIPATLKKIGKDILYKVLSTIKSLLAPLKKILDEVVDGLTKLDSSLSPNGAKNESEIDDFFDRLEKDVKVLNESRLMNEDLAGDIINPYIDKVTSEYQSLDFTSKVVKVIALVKQQEGEIDGLFVSRIFKDVAAKTGNEQPFTNITDVRIFVKENDIRNKIKAEMKELTGDAGDVDFDNEYDALHSEELGERVRNRMFRDKDYIAACQKLGLDYAEPENSFKVALQKQKWSILLGIASMGLTLWAGPLALVSVASLLASTLIPLGLEFLAAYGENENWDMKTVDRLKTIAKWSKRIGMAISLTNLAVTGWRMFADSGTQIVGDLGQAAAGGATVDPAVAQAAVAKLNASTEIAKIIDPTTIQMMSPANQVQLANLLDPNYAGSAGDLSKFVAGLNPDVAKAMDLAQLKLQVLAANPEVAKTAIEAGAQAVQQGTDVVKAKLDGIAAFTNASPEAQKALQAGIEAKKYTADAFAAMKPEQQAAFLKDIADGKMTQASYDMIQAAGKAKADVIAGATQNAAGATTTQAVSGGAALSPAQVTSISAETGLTPEAIKGLGAKNAELIQKAVSADGTLTADQLIKLKAEMLKNNPALDGKLGAIDAAIQKVNAVAEIKNMSVGDYSVAKNASGDSVLSVLKDRGINDTDVMSQIVAKAKEAGIPSNKFIDMLHNSNLPDGAIKAMNDSGQLKHYLELGNKFGENSELFQTITSKAGTGAMENMYRLANADIKPDIIAKMIANPNMTAETLKGLNDTQLGAYSTAFSKVVGNDVAVKNISELVAQGKLQAFSAGIEAKAITPELANKIYSVSAEKLATVQPESFLNAAKVASEAGVQDMNKIANLTQQSMDYFNGNVEGTTKVFSMLKDNTVTPEQLNTIMDTGKSNAFMDIVKKKVELTAEAVDKLAKINSNSIDQLTGLTPREITEILKNQKIEDLNNLDTLSGIVANQTSISAGLESANAGFTAVWSDPTNSLQIAALKEKGFDENTIKAAFNEIGKQLKDDAARVDYDQLLKQLSEKADSGWFSSDPGDIVAAMVKDGKVPTLPTPAA